MGEETAGLTAGVCKALLPRGAVQHIAGDSHSHSGLIEFQEAPMGMFALEMCSRVACSSKLPQKDGPPRAKWTTCVNRWPRAQKPEDCQAQEETLGPPAFLPVHTAARCHVTPGRRAKMRKTGEAQGREQVWTWEPACLCMCVESGPWRSPWGAVCGYQWTWLGTQPTESLRLSLRRQAGERSQRRGLWNPQTRNSLSAHPYRST